jgi:membrane dipeptidase
MIRALAERGGVAGINLSPGFLSQDHSTRYSEYRDKVMSEPGADQLTIDEIGLHMTEFEHSLPLAPLSLVADHVKHLVSVGGEDCVGFGGDLDGVDSLPAGMAGVADYLKFIDLLRAAGLSSSQVDKICHGNMLRVFGEVLPRA